jgi:predicted RNase H-like nuclease
MLPMSEAESFIVAGVDGCRAGWLVAIVEVNGKEYSFEARRTFVVGDFTAVLSATNDCDVVCVDIPIGLSDSDRPRKCDVEARKVLGRPRASSVFPAPIRQCLSVGGYEEASKISLEHSAKKLTLQAFAILDKIRRVDDLMTAELQHRIREIHPEILFWALNRRRPMQYKKSKVAGREERIKVLAPVLPNVGEIVAKVRKSKEAAPDDVLDALIASWAAGRVVLGKAATLPARPQTDSKGLRMEIVYPVGDLYWDATARGR